jgi:hypothetical protein
VRQLAVIGAFRKLVLIALVAGATSASAQDLEPRAYSNTPTGLNFLLAGYTYTKGGVAVDPSVPLKDAQISVNGATVAYAHSLDAWGQSAKFDIVLPYAWLSGTAEVAGQPAERKVAGLADPRFRFSVDFYGAPALSVKEFADYQQDLIVGASMSVWAPWGQYDATKLVNLGTNRWSFKTELGVSKALGAWTLEVIPAVSFFTNNTNFFGGNTRTQDPIYSMQAHAIYHFRSGIWMALDGTYFTGGQTRTGGVDDADRLSNSRAGVTVALPLDRSSSVKLYASTGISTRTGSDFNTFGVVWQYRWATER